MYQRIDDFVRKAQLVLGEQFNVEREEDFVLEDAERMFKVRLMLVRWYFCIGLVVNALAFACRSKKRA